jgi:hypothetical protein
MVWTIVAKREKRGVVERRGLVATPGNCLHDISKDSHHGKCAYSDQKLDQALAR